MAQAKGFKPPKVRNDLTTYLASLVKKQRVGVFIDAANLYYSAQIARLNLDYHSIADWFTKKSGDLSILNFYTAFDPEDKDQLAFLDDLKDTGYNVVSKPIKVFGNMIKGNMDIELAVDALAKGEEYDLIVLISGDGDFSYLIKELEKKGKKTVIVGVGGFTSFELHQEAENYFFFNRISRVWARKKKTTKKESVIPKIYADLVDSEATGEEMSIDKVPQSQAKKSKRSSSNSKASKDTRKAKDSKPTNTKKPKKPPVKLRVGKPKIFLS